MPTPRKLVARNGSPRPVQGIAAQTLVTQGVARFEQLLAEALDRSPAVTAKSGSDLAMLQRRCTVEVLRAAASALAEHHGSRGLLQGLRLFDDQFCAIDAAREVPALELDDATVEPEELGELLESLLSLSALHQKGKLRFGASLQRKQQGMFYTPRAVVASVVASALRPFLEARRLPERVCDPSFGGGAFLLGVARALASAGEAARDAGEAARDAGEAARDAGEAARDAGEAARDAGEAARDAGEAARETGGAMDRRAVVIRLHGFDLEPLAIAVTEASLLIWSQGGKVEARALREQLRHVDATLVQDAPSFDLVIGNPPWVAYAGRATQPIPDVRRAWLSDHFEAFHGYPTLQACFVELAARLTPMGRIALLVPSPLADLDGYRPMRRVLTRTHRVTDELVEYGQDAFEGVVQPCFGLIADANPSSQESDAPFSLVERSGLCATAARVEVPSCLQRLTTLPRLPHECFGEYGFQTTSEVTQNMLLRSDHPAPPYDYPLLQGRDVTEFVVGPPKLYLLPDRERLRRLQCRLRSPEEYQKVEFVVRQTAKYPIAALHSGVPFRNSLLAGFGTSTISSAVLVGLLNSTLFRSLHLAGQRDARQKTFPQVKIVHLRGLPAPPNARLTVELAQLVARLSGRKPNESERHRLNSLVYQCFELTQDESCVIDAFFLERAG